jgi:phenylacetate-CoA ligase
MARYYGLSDLQKSMNFFQKSQFWSPEKLRYYQVKRLKLLLIHAYETTEYYRKIFEECGFDPKQLQHIDDIAGLPLLTKDDIRKNVSSMISTQFSADAIHESETGGTTGVKMKFYRDNQCLGEKEAGLYRFEKWTGWNPGDRMGLVWPAQQDYVGHWTWKSRLKNEMFNRQVVLPAAILDDKAIRDYITQLQRKKPTMIRAFSSPIYEVACYILRNDIKIQPLNGIITTGEPLYAKQRDAIEQAFGCRVYDSYRCREAGPIAQECELHDGLHVNAENLLVEILPCTEMHACSNDLGEIVVTDLLNFGMPLIRYRMGDLARLNETQCACGRGLPRLHSIKGRTTDMFYSPGGKRIAAGSLVLYLVDEAPGKLGQVQLVQEKINHIIIRITKNPNPSDELINYQKETIRRLFGNEMKVNFEFVETIPREPSGKYQFTKCLIKNNLGKAI